MTAHLCEKGGLRLLLLEHEIFGVEDADGQGASAFTREVTSIALCRRAKLIAFLALFLGREIADRFIDQWQVDVSVRRAWAGLLIETTPRQTAARSSQ